PDEVLRKHMRASRVGVVVPGEVDGAGERASRMRVCGDVSLVAKRGRGVRKGRGGSGEGPGIAAVPRPVDVDATDRAVVEGGGAGVGLRRIRVLESERAVVDYVTETP